MGVASPPTGVSNGALIRWAFEILNTRDVQPLRALWTEATVERGHGGLEALVFIDQRPELVQPRAHFASLLI